MAIARKPIKCPHCGVMNYFKHNPNPHRIIGDTKGRYPTRCSTCKESLLIPPGLKPPTFTEEEIEFLKNLGKPKS